MNIWEVEVRRTSGKGPGMGAKIIIKVAGHPSRPQYKRLQDLPDWLGILRETARSSGAEFSVNYTRIPKRYRLQP